MSGMLGAFRERQSSDLRHGYVAGDALDTDNTQCMLCGNAGALACRCDHCSLRFCHECLPYEVHQCSEWMKIQAAKRSAGPVNVPAFCPCSHPGCSERTPVPLLCTYCNKSFCSKHKTEGDHDCPTWREHAKRQLQEAEAERAARSRQQRRPPQQQRIIPHGLHRDDAVMFSVLVPPGCGGGDLRAVSVNRNHAVGRTAEWLADALNAVGGSGTPRTRYALLRARDLWQLPPMMVSIKELVRRGDLRENDSLLLVPHEWCRADGGVHARCAAEAGSGPWVETVARAAATVAA